MILVTILVKEGEDILAQSENAIENGLHLKDFLEKTIPGFEEHVNSLLQTVETEV